MILIIGTNEDDILYFTTKMELEKVDEISGHTKVYLGRYSSQNVAISYTRSSMMVASLVTVLLIEKYHPYLVINVGSVHSFSPKLHQGDLFLAERIYIGDVDQTAQGRLKFGQVPDFPLFFHSEDTYLHLIEMFNNRLANKNMIRGTILSTNRFYTSRDDINVLVAKNFSYISNLMACDTETGGVALACHYFEIPLICLKSVSYEIGESEQLINYVRMGLAATPAIGAIVAALFSELGMAKK